MKAQKLSAAILSIAALAGVSSTALAAENIKIKSGVSEAKTSISIPVEDTTLKNTKVVISVQYTNEKTGKTKTKTFVKTLDANGDATVIVKGLTSNTQYKLSVKAKKNKSGASYSDSSSTKEVTTKK